MQREAEARFLVTRDCGRLARWLRLFGYDAAFCDSNDTAIIYQRAYNEKRTVLTRSSKVKQASLFKVVRIFSPVLEEQLRQLASEIGLKINKGDAFTRCNICNVEVGSVDKAEIKDEVPPFVYGRCDEFHRCPSCKRIYWEATHWQRAQKLIDKLNNETC
jgi:hypothetical protein